METFPWEQIMGNNQNQHKPIMLILIRMLSMLTAQFHQEKQNTPHANRRSPLREKLQGAPVLTGASPRTGSFLFTMISPLRLERSKLMVFHTFSRIGSLLLNYIHTVESLAWKSRPASRNRALKDLPRGFTFSDWPDGCGSLPQVVAKLQDPVVEGEGDEVTFPIWLLAIVEDQTVGVVCHENYCHADLLTAEKFRSGVLI